MQHRGVLSVRFLNVESGRMPHLFAVASNINMAIRACKEERAEVLRNQKQLQMVREALNEGYCDPSGHPTDMALIGECEPRRTSLRLVLLTIAL